MIYNFISCQPHFLGEKGKRCSGAFYTLQLDSLSYDSLSGLGCEEPKYPVSVNENIKAFHLKTGKSSL